MTKERDWLSCAGSPVTSICCDMWRTGSNTITYPSGNWSDATASRTKDVPGHIENAESRAVQKSRNYILLVEFVLGGKGEDVDTRKLAVRSVLDELFDGTHRFRFRRFSQSLEESVGFDGKFHGTIGLLSVTQLPCGYEKRNASDR